MERSPMERIFDVNNPTGSPFGNMLGLVGQVMGHKPYGESALEAQGEAIQELSARVQQGMSPQQAATDFLSTPKGMQLFSRGVYPQVLMQWKTLTDQTPQVGSIGPGQSPVVTTPGQKRPWIGEPTPTEAESTARTITPTQVVPPGHGVLPRPRPSGAPPAPYTQPTEAQQTSTTIPPAATTGPGQTLHTLQNGQYKPTFTNPTTQMQDFDSFRTIAGLPSGVVQRLAQMQMTPPDQRPTEMKRTLDEMVAAKQLDPKTANLLAVHAFGPQGVIRIVPKLNRHGEQIGSSVIDLIGNRSMDVGQISTGPGTDTSLPGTPAAPPAAPGSPNATTGPGAIPRTAPPGSPAAPLAPPLNLQNPESPYSDKLQMFFAPGLFPQLNAALGSMARQVDSRISIPGSEDASANTDAMRNLAFALAGLTREGAGLNIPSKYLALAEALGPSASVWNDPKNAVRQAIDLHGRMQQAIREDRALLVDREQSHDSKRRAERRIETYGNVLEALPPLNSMIHLREDIAKNGPITRANEMSPGRFLSNLVSGTKQVVTTGADQARETGAVPGAIPAANRFSKMSNEAFMALEPEKVRPKDMPTYLQELKRRRALIGGAKQ